VQRNPENLPLVLANQRIVCGNITTAYPFYQGYVGMLFAFTCYWLDDWHWRWLRKFLGAD
jgi:hypothetical protein